MDTESIKTKIELKLRMAGIKVSENDGYNLSNIPLLVLEIFFIKNNYIKNIDVYSFSLHLELFEYLNLPRAKISNYLCSTWQRSFYGVCDRKDYYNQASNGIESLLNAYMNEYLRDNQK